VSDNQISQAHAQGRKEPSDIIVPIRRQLLGVLVLGLLAAAAYRHLEFPAWWAWVGVIFSVIYVLFSDRLYHWSRSMRTASNPDQGH
jgi:hypothetical protein